MKLDGFSKGLRQHSSASRIPFAQRTAGLLRKPGSCSSLL
nr:MAG TPA_asm: hypothetical protein [Caudoviricetes sp.]